MIQTLLLFLALLIQSNAHAFGIGAYGGLSLAMPSWSNGNFGSTVSTSAKGDFTYGAFISIDVIPFFIDLEVGAQSLSRSFQVSESITSATGSKTTFRQNTSATYLQIPIIIRLKPVPFFSPGAGVAYGIGYGSVRTSAEGEVDGVSRASLTSAETTKSFSDASLGSSVFSFVLSARFSKELFPLCDAFIDANYYYGLNNINLIAGGNSTYRDLMFLAGAKLGF